MNGMLHEVHVMRRYRAWNKTPAVSEALLLQFLYNCYITMFLDSFPMKSGKSLCLVTRLCASIVLLGIQGPSPLFELQKYVASRAEASRTPQPILPKIWNHHHHHHRSLFSRHHMGEVQRNRNVTDCTTVRMAGWLFNNSTRLGMPGHTSSIEPT